MKIFTIHLDMTAALGQLKRFRLQEFNVSNPIIFIEADNPDDACYFMFCKFSEMLLRQDESLETAQLLKRVQNDIKIIKVFCKG